MREVEIEEVKDGQLVIGLLVIGLLVTDDTGSVHKTVSTAGYTPYP